MGPASTTHGTIPGVEGRQILETDIHTRNVVKAGAPGGDLESSAEDDLLPA